MNPEYPVYVISKGRATLEKHTGRNLDRIAVPYTLVVEPQEVEDYIANGFRRNDILVTPFSNLGQGSIPARNFVWGHALSLGVQRHWILDDNIVRDGFYRYNRNLKVPVSSGSIFRSAEEFVDRYDNIALAGFNYFMFVLRKSPPPPFYLNTRVYSCILINNSIPYRWRGRYNEDTDLSLCALKGGWCTVLFNSFLIWKATTMIYSGGNTDELYQGDGRLKMAQSLVDQHPDVAKVTWRFDRWQHCVDYRKFRTQNKLKLKPGIEIPQGIDNHGMVLQRLIGGEWRPVN